MAHHALLCFYETVSSGWRIQRPALGQMVWPVFSCHTVQASTLTGRVGGGEGGYLIARWISRASKLFPPHGFARALLVAPAEPYGPGTFCSCEGRRNTSHKHHRFIHSINIWALRFTLLPLSRLLLHTQNSHNKDTTTSMRISSFINKHTIHCTIWEREKH